MDRGDLEFALRLVVEYRKHLELANQARRQELRDETLVLEVAHREVERLLPVGSGDIGEPLAIFLGRLDTDALDVGHHRVTERVRIDAAVKLAVEIGLRDDVGMALDEFEHESVGHLAAVVELVHDVVVPKTGPALVHYLGLALWVKILADLAHDAHHFTLPWLQ